MSSFIDRVKERTAVIGVIGQGYGGVPLGWCVESGRGPARWCAVSVR
jgi:hypothetical protein